MWWHDIIALDKRIADLLATSEVLIADSARIEPGVILDESCGPIAVGANSIICSGAIIRGPVVIGRDCLIGNYALVRGSTQIADGTRVGFATEVKHSIIGHGVSIGPQCFIADSLIDAGAYLGAMVRTSNHRLDRKSVRVSQENELVDSGCEKLGCWVGKGASLGIQVIVLPGRVIAPDSLFEPRITVSRNLPTAHYRLSQTLQAA